MNLFEGITTITNSKKLWNFGKILNRVKIIIEFDRKQKVWKDLENRKRIWQNYRLVKSA